MNTDIYLYIYIVIIYLYILSYNIGSIASEKIKNSNEAKEFANKSLSFKNNIEKGLKDKVEELQKQLKEHKK